MFQRSDLLIAVNPVINQKALCLRVVACPVKRALSFVSPGCESRRGGIGCGYTASAYQLSAMSYEL